MIGDYVSLLILGVIYAAVSVEFGRVENERQRAFRAMMTMDRSVEEAQRYAP